VGRVRDAGLPLEIRNGDSVAVRDPAGNLVILLCR
jgi:catechol 2,3-dioxygenase-like lactoylglutathione lyase family enzyme